MAVKLPNGATVHIATALAAEKKATVATNAAECVLTVAGHGFANGDLVLFKSGWGKLNERVFQIGDVKADTFKLTGIDTSNADEFPAGSGIGAVQKITDWVQVSQIVEFSTSGGEQQYVDFGFLEDDFDQRIPSTKSAMSMSIKIADDTSLSGYKAAAKCSDKGGKWPLKVVLKGGGLICYNGYPSMNKTPELVRNQVMAVTLSYAISGEVNRY
ncbi:phage tail protein [Neisseria meningitidis]|uniref:phage tail protein n=1 Tax=Neisseria meningitidis TaxID=487 RepID=UPI001EE0F6C8|nr:phage tail protein [Neisseria meningitidis]MCG3262015.1 phage tail protein [Neisseria meningitidis]MCG3270302.1 phage tail protein [Neisseria meningitidis]MCG3278307.1 phage tail protein [Neisseria meningitidis]MCZ2068336.1 phage tail protein [Neisseria meningitidis]MCZ2069856.1 phage tail protein [Neisseria meningitidis]